MADASNPQTPSTSKGQVRVNWMGFLYIALTILFTVYGQVVIKWQVNLAGDFPPDTMDKVWFIFKLLLNVWVISSFAAAFVASLTWMAAMTQFELSFAYPFMSLAYIIVLFLSVALFAEAFTWQKLIGTLIIVAGLFVLTR
jgi:multidrug transporter EmrE-like cation transporter